jgi:hypothetical protein
LSTTSSLARTRSASCLPQISMNLSSFSMRSVPTTTALEWTDSLSGSQVYVDTAANTMFLGYAGSWAVVHGTTQIAAADWEMTGW